MNYRKALQKAIDLVYAEERRLAKYKSANLFNPELCKDEAAEYDELVDIHAVLLEILSLPHDPRQSRMF